MNWRDPQALFTLWLLVLLFYAARAILPRSGAPRYPTQELAGLLNFLLTALMVPPVVAALSCLSGPVPRLVVRSDPSDRLEA